MERAPELVSASRQTPAWATLLKYYLEFGKPQYPLHLPLRGGGGCWTLSDPSEVKVFWNLFIHGAYRIPADCETILDCGANAGIFCLWAVRQRSRARIVALEPFPPTFAKLEVNVRQNHLENQIQCIQVGLAAVAGQRSMFTGGDSPLRSLVPNDLQTPPETTRVRCIRLADCLQDFRMEKLDLLKMDIEGSEWEVLLSTEPSVLSGIRHIQVEYHEAPARFGYTPEKLFAHLMEAGHKLTFRFEDAYRTGLAHFERVPN
jgi:FkbM family methyltransferase